MATAGGGQTTDWVEIRPGVGGRVVVPSLVYGEGMGTPKEDHLPAGRVVDHGVALACRRQNAAGVEVAPGALCPCCRRGHGSSRRRRGGPGDSAAGFAHGRAAGCFGGATGE